MKEIILQSLGDEIKDSDIDIRFKFTHRDENVAEQIGFVEKSPTVCLYEAVCEIQNGPNPLTEEELDRFVQRQPKYKNAVAAWRHGQKS